MGVSLSSEYREPEVVTSRQSTEGHAEGAQESHGVPTASSAEETMQAGKQQLHGPTGLGGVPSFTHRVETLQDTWIFRVQERTLRRQYCLRKGTN